MWGSGWLEVEWGGGGGRGLYIYQGCVYIHYYSELAHGMQRHGPLFLISFHKMKKTHLKKTACGWNGFDLSICWPVSVYGILLWSVPGNVWGRCMINVRGGVDQVTRPR